MMMTTIDKSAILARIAGDKRQVGAKIAKELESVEIVISDKKNDKNVIERHKDENGKTTITLYEQNIGTKNKEAIVAYYLSLEGTKMLIAEKSTIEETKLKTNAENLIAANEVAFGIVNATETSEEAKAQLLAIRKDIDNEVGKLKEKGELTTGNSDAVEALATQGITGLDSVEARAKKLNGTEEKNETKTEENSDSNTETETEADAESSASSQSSAKSSAKSSSASSSTITTPRSTLQKDTTTTITKPRATLVGDEDTASFTTDNELVDAGNGTTITRKEARTVLKAKMPTMTDEQINVLVGQLTTVSATGVANSADMFNIGGTLMTKLQATAKILAELPTAKPEDIDTFLKPYKVASGATANALGSNSLAGILNPLPTTSPYGISSFPSLTNTGYNPTITGVQPRSVFNNTPYTYTNPSVFSNLLQPTGLGLGTMTGRTPSGLPIVKAS